MPRVGPVANRRGNVRAVRPIDLYGLGWGSQSRAPPGTWAPLGFASLREHLAGAGAGALFAGATICRVRSWMSAWVFLLLGGMDSIVFGPIRWCVWSFRLSSPLRLPHLQFLFVCLFSRLCSMVEAMIMPMIMEAMIMPCPRSCLALDQVLPLILACLCCSIHASHHPLTRHHSFLSCSPIATLGSSVPRARGLLLLHVLPLPAHIPPHPHFVLSPAPAHG